MYSIALSTSSAAASLTLQKRSGKAAIWSSHVLGCML